MNILRNADVAVGDLENELRDFDNFGHIGGNLATKEVADDLAYMGIDMVSRANNKQTDWRQRSRGFPQGRTCRHRAMGRGPDTGRSAHARNFATPKGLVGMVGSTAMAARRPVALAAQVVYVTAAQLRR